ncbi:cytochrome P450 [Lentinus tigrinus ALCF2SS1-7]|uniref:Cytochrome P450 n=1 Tax=Lentinus tigrinus ALCF2SS1-6 TaxID=1328759 RepID=A0A5C2SD52_9APHY|nr:cytochrome P450 [Lentinus tigrinus ALCF2SS1-6]RPD73611.1 cytochrome P450 [Lentinus tigrinus ALCF2SS1-7]
MPIVGNLLQLSQDAWLKFTDWKHVYGPIVYLNLAGQDVIVLNTLQAAADLLDRRASIYSSRPRFEVACNMLTEGMFFVFQGYTDRWRRMRRAAHESLHSGLMKNYHPIQTLETAILLKDMVKAPHDWDKHLRRTAASTVLSITYGLPPLKDVDDPSMATLENFLGKIVRAGYVDGFLIELFPSLMRIPALLAPWKKEAHEWAPQFTGLFEGLYAGVKEKVLEGDARPSFSASMVEKQIKFDLNDKETAWLVGTVATAYETISATMAWFMLAMVLYPEAQRKAHKELDAVVGRSRLPTLDDFESLVYIQAMVKEILRWHPVGPLGVQHRSTEDDVYEGYFIPKGTICIANIWGINRDPELWGPDADQFKPDRHIGSDGKLAPSPPDTKEEGHVSFGFGRRICVGRHLGRNSLFLNIASVLWMFTVKAPLGPDGQEVVCTEKSVDMGLVVRPQEYDYRFELRIPDAEEILNSHEEVL